MKMIDIIKCIDKSNNRVVNYFIINNISTVNTDEILELLHKYNYFDNSYNKDWFSRLLLGNLVEDFKVNLKLETISEYDLEQLNIEVVKVEMILNQLNRLKNNQEIANYIIERDLLKTKCQLELSLASLCIILRKMCENQFITLNQERRKDINSIIHSNRFDFFEDDKVYVFSQKGQEEVNIIQLLDYAKKIFKEIV